jgi:hypothetical protein
MTSTHARRVTDIRVNASFSLRPAAPAQLGRKGATPSHVVPRHRPNTAPTRNFIALNAERRISLPVTASASASPRPAARPSRQSPPSAPTSIEDIARLQDRSSKRAVLPSDTPFFYCTICDNYQKKNECLTQACHNEDCDVLVCRACLFTYIDGIVQSSPYSMPPIRCCGCRTSIPSHVWKAELVYPTCSTGRNRLTGAEIFREALLELMNKQQHQKQREQREREQQQLQQHTAEEEESSANDVITLASLFFGSDDDIDIGEDQSMIEFPSPAVPPIEVTSAELRELHAFDPKASTVVKVMIPSQTLKSGQNSLIESLGSKCKKSLYILFYLEYVLIIIIIVFLDVNGGKTMFSLRCRGMYCIVLLLLLLLLYFSKQFVTDSFFL